MCKNKLEFPGERGVQTKKPSVGGVWIFSGTYTQYKKIAATGIFQMTIHKVENRHFTFHGKTYGNSWLTKMPLAINNYFCLFWVGVASAGSTISE